jgi:prevent-host-death family protein
MTRVKIRELKAHASELIRRVHEDGETIEITLRGRAVARLAPLANMPASSFQVRALARLAPLANVSASSPQERADFWAEWRELSKRIGEAWPQGFSAGDAVREQRRDL